MIEMRRKQLSFGDGLIAEEVSDLREGWMKHADAVLADEAIVAAVYEALAKRHPKSRCRGRRGTPADIVLRLLILKHIRNWSYEVLEREVRANLVYRDFTHVGAAKMPDAKTMGRWGLALGPEVLKQVHERIVTIAREQGVTTGQRMRVDTTVVETDIHHPTDNTLLWDTVRVITRGVRRLSQAIRRGVQGFRNRTRAARRRMLQIQRMTAKDRHHHQAQIYRELIEITEEVVDGARQVLRRTRAARGKDPIAALALGALRTEIADYCQLGDRVIDQARRRVLEGEQVPTAEKLYSIFEPHTDLIKRGKVLTPVEFGHKVFLAESEQGLITQYEVLTGNPSDEDHVEPSLDRHRDTFGRAPDLYGSDRGFYSERNVKACRDEGVTIVCIPQRGGKKTSKRDAYEKSAAFKRGQRFRAGIEGRISVLFRGRGMKRCLAEGRERFELLVGAAVLANNLMRIAALLMTRAPRRRRAA